LRPWIRRAAPSADSRILIDDSKVIYKNRQGLAKLEQGLAATSGLPAGPFADWVAAVGLPGVAGDLAAEVWFDPTASIPIFPDAPGRVDLGLPVRVLAVNIVTTPIFNRVVLGSNSKATVVAIGVVELLRVADQTLPVSEPLLVTADKQGGRTFYAPLLQAVFPDREVVIECETAEESRYRVAGSGRPVRVVFRPRAEAGSVPVALASMLCKYIREVCMGQFNRFWAGRVPGLKPTAGYPGDARRFLDAIRPALVTLGLPEAAVWRCR
jgi:hypothetical protein